MTSARRRSLLRLAVTAGLAAPAPLRIRPAASAAGNAPAPSGFRVTYFAARPGSGSRDVACSPADATVWYCGQRDGTLTRFDPRDGSLHPVPLGPGAAPHGVVFSPDGALWVTEGGQNAIARVDPRDFRVQLWRLPEARANANLNTGVFDRDGFLWFTGQNGIYGRFDPRTERMAVWDAPRGRGPYGITVTPEGSVWFVSLAGSYLAQVEDRETGRVRVVEPPTPRQGARRVWTDSQGRLWISEWNSGNVSMHDPRDGSWKVWRLPGERPRCYAVYVDEQDMVWLTDFAANAILRFDPRSETFLAFPSDRPGANVRHLGGRRGEIWGGESGNNRLVRIETPA
ncbi:MAG: lyase [Acetobacteraceae bacterium]|nr:lyase [Acetobacteraceae bacterium]